MHYVHKVSILENSVDPDQLASGVSCSGFALSHPDDEFMLIIKVLDYGNFEVSPMKIRHLIHLI